jgi:hypothetical protein
MTAMEVYFVNIYCSCVVVPARWFLTICFWLAAANQVVEVKHVEIV